MQYYGDETHKCPMEPDRAVSYFPNTKKDGRGRPALHPGEMLKGILWILRTGAPRKIMPQRYPPYQTWYGRFKQWVRQSVFKRDVQELTEDLYRRGGTDIREAFLDGTFAPAKKGGLLSARQRPVSTISQ